MTALYDRLGGEAAIMATAGPLYERLVADQITRQFFIDLDLETVTSTQVAFLSAAFGDPSARRGVDPRAAHALLLPVGLDDVHFDAVRFHLEAVLRQLGVELGLIAEVSLLVSSLRSEVLGR